MSAKPEPFWIARIAAGGAPRLRDPGESVEDYRVAMGWDQPKPELRTWGEGTRCDECCTGDRCDDPTHRSREHCPHCKGTGWALWTAAGRRDYAAYLLGGNTSDKRAAILAAVDGAAMADAKATGGAS